MYQEEVLILVSSNRAVDDCSGRRIAVDVCSWRVIVNPSVDPLLDNNVDQRGNFDWRQVRWTKHEVAVAK